MEKRKFIGHIEFVENEKPKKKSKISRTKRTFPIENGILETLERAAYWDRIEKNRIIEKALEAFFKDKNYKAIPDGN